MKTKLISIFVYMLVFTSLTAQDGTIRGTMYDDTNGEPILFGTILIDETGDGTTSDLDGAYTLQLAPGTYNLTFQYLGFADLKISDVIVESGKVTQLEARLKEDAEVLDEVVITASQARNTEAALATIKRKSTNVIDGISSASFKRMGDSNAAAAAKRVPGVSIQNGKYVYVRGLGDRYTKSILNGMDIPGLDPDRNTLQMDIFPTNVLDNIIVLKSFTADLPADFTGGVVDITTKDFPEDRVMAISGSIGYNPNMHLKSNYLTYDGGKTDWLGFDDGTRAIPTDRKTNFPTYVDALTSTTAANTMNGILNNFNSTLAGYRDQSMMDFGLGISIGNQINRGSNSIGYNLALSYKNTTDYYENVVNANWGKSPDRSVNELERRELQTGDIGKNNVLLGGLAGIAFKTKTAKYKLNLLHLQNGEKQAGVFDFINTDQGANFEAKQHNLEYSERQLTNILLAGNHILGQGKWEIDWRLSPTRSLQTEPDIRYTRVRQKDNGAWAIGSESGIPERIWRYLEEYNYSGKLDFVRNFKFNEEDAKVRFGLANTYKNRAYEIQNFQIFPNGSDVTEDPNTLFQPENLFSTENRSGLYYSPQFVPNNPNKYDAFANTGAAYVSAELHATKHLKAIVGVRGEGYHQTYKGENNRGEQLEETIDAINVFPSLNLIYAVNDRMNIRASATRTVARPSFKEASYATIIDPITGRTFIGGFFQDVDVTSGEVIWDGNLKQTNITNFDLRWETFQSRGQGISISAFYKHFQDPIEIVQYSQAPSNLQPRNVGTGQVLGAELELKQSFGLIAESLENLAFNVNFTYTKSSIDFTSKEMKSREFNKRDGEVIATSRDMSGQAPYLINAGLAYNGFDNGMELGLFYNVQGRTLQYVGISDRPNVYSEPFHSLNFKASKQFGAEQRISLSVTVDNILDAKRESVFTSFMAEDQLFSSLEPGRSFGLSLGYRIY